MQIELLADRPEFVSLLAAWHQAEWASLRPGFTLEDRVAKLRGACGRAQPPVVFVASEGERLLGSAMLLAQDMDTRPELTPWLGGVFTAPEVRRRGIASALSRQVVRHAAGLGFSRLYLYTPSAADFYARLGWTVLERTCYRDAQVTVMFHEEGISSGTNLDREATAPVVRKQLSIGGLMAAGFDPSGAYLLTLSHSGRGVFSTASWERVARDTQVVYPEGGVGRGIGPLDGVSVAVKEVDYETGQWRLSSSDGRLSLAYEEGILTITDAA